MTATARVWHRTRAARCAWSRVLHCQVGRDAITGVEHDDVVDNQLGRVDVEARSVSQHGGSARQQVAEPFGRVLGAVLLREREHAVEQDDDEDGDAQLRQARDDGQHTGGPQHRREEVEAEPTVPKVPAARGPVTVAPPSRRRGR